MGRLAPITRRDLLELTTGNLVQDAWHKPEIRPVEIRGRACLVKDYGRRPFLFRHTVGRLVISREVDIYRALGGLPGTPRFHGQVDPFAFVVERIEGRPVAEFRKRTLPPGFLDRLSSLVAAIHAKGVAHWDLRQRRNVLVGPGGGPWVIDFASGIRLPRGSWLHRLACLPDLSGVAKLRAKHAPDTLTEEDRRLIGMERFRPFRRKRTKSRVARRRRARGLD
ncbi:MAG: BUD32 family EKC/KEOPS complex subunit [Planctomycetota bacterium]|jgi:RIO-like serine/threonine protein kinase